MGVDCTGNFFRKKAIEKTILRIIRPGAFSHSLGPNSEVEARKRGVCIAPATGHRDPEQPVNLADPSEPWWPEPVGPPASGHFGGILTNALCLKCPSFPESGFKNLGALAAADDRLAASARG